MKEDIYLHSESKLEEEKKICSQCIAKLREKPTDDLTKFIASQAKDLRLLDENVEFVGKALCFVCGELKEACYKKGGQEPLREPTIYTDPVTKESFKFVLADINELTITDCQRNLYSSHINKLAQSMMHGFISAIVAVEFEGKLVVIDGQHRLQALRKILQKALVPTIVVPSRYAILPLIYNVEKADNIKDKCFRIAVLYNQWQGEDERELESATMNQPHLLTLAIAHTQMGVESPTLVETLVKKFDSFISDPGAKLLREARAEKVGEIYREIYQVCETFGISDWQLVRAVVSKTTQILWGRKRNIPGTFDENLEKFRETLKETDFSFLGER